MKHENNKICYTNEKLKEIIEKHKKWLNYEKDGEKADLQGADLRNADLQGTNLQGADLDFSCLPLWCGSLLANMDDGQVKQLLYHILSIVKHSNNVSETIKAALLTDKNIKIAKEFHRANECNKL